VSDAASRSTEASRWLPALGWLRGDVVAGITLAAYLLPSGLGDASLANLPPEAGLKAWLERQKEGNTLEAARAWAQQYKARHRKDHGR
jgi:hypothetical protein